MVCKVEAHYGAERERERAGQNERRETMEGFALLLLFHFLDVVREQVILFVKDSK